MLAVAMVGLGGWQALRATIVSVHGPLTAGFVGKVSHDFGIVPLDEDGVAIEHTFELRNALSKPIRIVALSSTCGCTEVKADRDIVVPGEALFVRAVLRLSDAGPKSAQVRLVTDDAEQSVCLLSLRATGRLSRMLTIDRYAVRFVANEPVLLNAFVVNYDTDQTPSMLEVEAPDGIEVDQEAWRLIDKGNERVGLPARWVASVKLVLTTPGAMGGVEWGVVRLTLPGLRSVEVQVNVSDDEAMR